MKFGVIRTSVCIRYAGIGVEYSLQQYSKATVSPWHLIELFHVEITKYVQQQVVTQS